MKNKTIYYKVKEFASLANNSIVEIPCLCEGVGLAVAYAPRKANHKYAKGCGCIIFAKKTRRKHNGKCVWEDINEFINNGEDFVDERIRKLLKQLDKKYETKVILDTE